MIRGLYTSALGMTTQMKKMDVVSNNLANADTTGFKKDSVVTSSFPDLLMKRLDDPRYNILRHSERTGNLTLGVMIDSVYTDFSQGSLRESPDPSNLAISGSGFIVVSATDPNGNTTEKYTRDGSFITSDTNILMTKEGNYVMGRNGQITIPNGELDIDDRGNIFVNNELIDAIRTIDFENPETLQKVGDNLYDRTAQTIDAPFTGEIVQGYLENSNVSIVRDMVDMITVSRAYEANSKMIQTHDTTLSKAVTEIARK